MTLNEAKEQIAKEYEHESWTVMTYRLNKDAVNELLLEAHELVLSSKDKEIAELKGQVKNLEEWQQVKEREADAEALSIALADAEMELKETHSKEVAALNQRIDDLKSGKYIADLESELSQLKDHNGILEKFIQAKDICISGHEEGNKALLKTIDEKDQQIQSLQEENKRLKNAGETFYKDLLFLREEMKKKEEEINQLKCTHEVFNMSACVACGFKRINDNEID